jgi:hypothetical protein
MARGVLPTLDSLQTQHMEGAVAALLAKDGAWAGLPGDDDNDSGSSFPPPPPPSSSGGGGGGNGFGAAEESEDEEERPRMGWGGGRDDEPVQVMPSLRSTPKARTFWGCRYSSSCLNCASSSGSFRASGS